MAKCFAECVESFEHVIPATTLESRLWAGEVVSVLELPEKRFSFTVGERVAFRTKKDCAAFVKAHGGKFVIVA